MDLIVVQNIHRGWAEVCGYAASPKTGRIFSQTVRVSNEEDSADAISTAKKKLQSDHAAFIDRDDKIIEFFNVTLKKVNLSSDDVAHMTVVEMDRLIDQGVLDRDALEEAAPFYGFKNDKFSGSSLHLAQLKVILQKNSNFPLGALAAKGKTVCRLKSGVDPAQFVDRNGLNAVLKDGTIVGEPVLTKKIERFLKSLSDELEIVKGLSEANHVREKIKRFTRLVGHEGVERLLDKINRNPIVQEGRYSDNAQKKALSDQLTELPTERRQNNITNLVDSVSLSDAEGGRDLVSSFKSRAFDYINALEGQGGHTVLGESVTTDLIAHANECVTKITEAQEGAKNLKSAVLSKLRAANKPLTERRIAVAGDEFMKDSGMNSNPFIFFSRWNVREIFGEEIRGDAELRLAERSQKKITKFSAKRIKKPETANREIFTRGDLTAADRSVLIKCVAGDPGVLLATIKEAACSGDSDLLKAIFSKAEIETRALAKERGWRYSSSDRSFVIECFVAAGAAEEAPWEEVSRVNVFKVAAHAPSAHQLRVTLVMLQSCDCDEELELVDRCLHRLGDLSAEEQIELAKAMRYHLGRFGFKPLAAFQSLAAKYANSPEFEILNEITVAEEGGKIVLGDQKIQSALLRSDLSLYYFGVFDGQGNRNLAARFLRAATNVKSTNSVDGYLEAKSPNFRKSIDVWSEALGDKYIISQKEYAEILVAKITEDEVILPSLGGTIDLLGTLFSTTSIGATEAANIVDRLYGKKSEEFQHFAGLAGTLRDEDIVLDLISAKNAKIEEMEREYMKAPEWERRKLNRFRERYNRFYYIEDHNIGLFEKLCIIDPLFCNLANIKKLTPKQADSFCSSVIDLVAAHASVALETFSHHAYFDSVTRFFSLFRAHPEPAVDAVLRSDITPKQAVAVAEGLSPQVRQELRERLLALVDRSPAAREEMRELLNLASDKRDQTRQNDEPGALVGRVIGGDKKLSESQWQVLFSSDVATRTLCINLPEGDLEQMVLFAKAFDINLARSIYQGATMLIDHWNLDDEIGAIERIAVLLRVLSKSAPHSVEGAYSSMVSSAFAQLRDFAKKVALVSTEAEVLKIDSEAWVAPLRERLMAEGGADISNQEALWILAAAHQHNELKVMLRQNLRHLENESPLSVLSLDDL